MQGIRERTMKNNFSVLFNTNDTEIVQVIVNSSSNSDFGKKIFMKIKLGLYKLCKGFSKG